MIQFLSVCIVLLLNASFLREIKTFSTSDLYLTAPQLIEKNGYPSEIHTVVTSDGYILEVHRIPHGLKSTNETNRPVVIVQHGLFSSSADWIDLGPEKGLGYLLADAGFDVWMGNARGNVYSKGHVYLNTMSYKYWDFSWHEMGIFDLPAVFDYILATTNQKDMYYVGHSMGTTMFYVLMSIFPQYNTKVRHMISLAPIAYMAHTNSPLIKLASCNPLTQPGLFTLAMLGMGEVAPHVNFLDELRDFFCSDASLLKDICHHIVFRTLGSAFTNINVSSIPMIEAHVPAGSSFKTVLHYLQEIGTKNGNFKQWDYYTLNWSMYRQDTPPEYNVSAISTPISLFYGESDSLGDHLDVAMLNQTLPNSAGMYRVPLDSFDHLDFLWANDVKELLYDSVIDILKKN